jgi:hypothetical protein
MWTFGFELWTVVISGLLQGQNVKRIIKHVGLKYPIIGNHALLPLMLFDLDKTLINFCNTVLMSIKAREIV